MDPSLRSHYLADNPPTVVRLEIAPHFAALSPKQKRYAHHLSRASFHGTRVTLAQVSPESPAIYDLILALHRACTGDYKKLSTDTSVSSSDITLWLEYAAQFLGNLGNYKGFGDSKFIPRISPEDLKKLCDVNDECKSLHEKATKTGGGIYETKNAALMHLGYPEAGHMTAYYPNSPTVTKEEISIVGDVLEEKKLLIENTRLRKLDSGDFELLIASGVSNPPASERDLGDVSSIDLTGKLADKKLHLRFGDYQEEMAKIALEIKKARKDAANEVEEKMLDEYARSFGTGSIQGFVESQRYWIKNKKPMVETDIGFVETYRDPQGVRGEWEGFVAMVNQERTRAFGKLVDAAPSMIPKLPWSKEFEKDKFLSPDFTSLEVLTFAGSGIPAGINIPNYDFIRQNEGFKNVSLGNVLSAKAPNEPIQFIRKEDDQLFRKYRDPAFEIQVGIHELLGHGCGKLLQETAPGEYNFDIKHPPMSPITKKPILSYYKPGQTWSSVFGSIASSYEECRAECVAMALSCDFGILEIFGFGDGKEDISNEAGDVLYAAYLQMARAGVAALEFWDPKSRKWGQAHMQARFSILRTFMDGGENFCELKSPNADIKNPDDLEIHLDRNKILSHGRPAVEAYLQKLHIYKSTADFEAGKKLYDDITNVDEWWAEKARPIVLKKKIPRKVFVQANTVLDENSGDVKLVEYEPTIEGMIQSYVERNV
ncbi:dipeptidyl-peptidase III [Cladophialophora psammophila CBS 110553]|uniref:Dipeptidyl peptidase 3 n=1 Tax=Cladophialophora psammophila CBS 110553 TaxID=1182543 RepID=W9WU50_9EURO|nr:dipeptidyl-peptidase III [Cladophialophora psammophila CBS 110553]EXJ71737.1 dipeptidyl-peptidase III [Cladophialophora psammophila CBS 110553]